MNSFAQRIGIGTAETFKEILLFSKKSFDQALIETFVEKKIQKQNYWTDQNNFWNRFMGKQNWGWHP